MWSILNGTIVNVLTVAVGSAVGLAAGGRLPERFQTIILQCLGLVTVTLAVDAGVLEFARTVEAYGPQVMDGQTYGARLAIVMIVALLVGGIAGTALKLHERIEGLGQWIHDRFSPAPDGVADEATGHRFAEGFLTASVVFCVGPLTLVGCLRNGAACDPSFLYIKALLDGFCSTALAAALGWGVAVSVLTVLVFQGGLSILAYYVAEPLHEVSIGLMTVVGGIVLLATALTLLDVKRIPVANLLPAIFLPPVLIAAIEVVSPGLLLPAG